MRAMRHLGGVTLALLVAMPASVTSLEAKANPQVEENPVSGYDSTQLSDLEIETLLLEGRVVDRENLDVGVTLPERLWLERDGHRVSAAFKHLDYERKGLTEFERAPPELNFKDSYRYERAAYLLDRLLGLGMVPVTVLRREQSKEGALVAWVEDAITEQERLRLKLAPEDTDLLIRQRADMRLFDALVYNLDNNLGNQLWTQHDWKLHLIDHSRAFRQQKSLPESFEKRPVSLTQELYDVLRTLEESQIREALGKVLSPRELKTLLVRMDRILKKIELDRSKYGDGFVFHETPASPDFSNPTPDQER